MKDVRVLDSSTRNLFLISDVHANAPALRAVLDEIPRDALILCAGDIVGYYMNPNEVCVMLRDRGVLCVLGNHDDYVVSGQALAPERDAKYMTSWTRAELSTENFQWLKSLPAEIEFRLPPSGDERQPGRLRLVHGSIFSMEDRLYPDTPLGQFVDENSDVIVGGHTHHPMARHSGSTLFVNPGSVGQPRNWKPGAAFAVLNTLDKSVEFKWVPYDIAHYVSKLKEAGFPTDMVEVLMRQRH
jgi:predicted phosphodiesterase